MSVRLIVFILASLTVQAQAASFTSENHPQSYAEKALGGSCYLLDPFENMIPCNPALLAFPQTSSFGAQLHFGNNITELGYVDEFVSGRISPSLQRDLFEERRPLYAEANSEIQFRSSKWSLGVTPYHARIYSEFKNYALPQVHVVALEEQSVQAQFASYLENDLFFGIRLRAVDRDLFIDRFGLFDYLAETPSFDSQDQQAFYIEPGILFERENDPWRFRMSAQLLNVGYLSKKYEGFDASPSLLLGTGINPLLEFGELFVGLSYEASEENSETLEEGFSFTTAYKLGVASFSFLISSSIQSLGLLAQHYGLEGGVIFVDQRIGKNHYGDAIHDQSIQAHFGVRF